MAARLTQEELDDINEAGILLEAGSILLSSSPASGGAAPASKWAIEALRNVVVVAGEGDQLECAICLLEEDQINNAARWKEMPCGHRFHGGCLEKWLHVHGTCPLCRRPLSPPAPEMTRVEYMILRYHWFVAAQNFLERAGHL